MEEEPLPTTATILGTLPPTDPTVLAAIESSRAETRHYAAIGQVAAGWSYFEAVVDTWSITLAGLDAKTGVCLTSQVAGIGRKLDAYISLARLSDISPKIIKALCDFAIDAQRLSERRNRIVHDVWMFDHPSVPERLEASARKVLRIERIPMHTDEVLKLATDIDQHRGRFDDMAGRLFAGFHSSPNKAPPDSRR